jgi:hypothetical protein
MTGAHSACLFSRRKGALVAQTKLHLQPPLPPPSPPLRGRYAQLLHAGRERRVQQSRVVLEQPHHQPPRDAREVGVPGAAEQQPSQQQKITTTPTTTTAARAATEAAATTATTARISPPPIHRTLKKAKGVSGLGAVRGAAPLTFPRLREVEQEPACTRAISRHHATTQLRHHANHADHAAKHST